MIFLQQSISLAYQFFLYTERVSYGLTTNITTDNPLKVATHEYAAIWRDVRSASRLRHRLGFIFGRPGYQPAA